ncbi:MAG: molybdenum cofactor biosynthesis protein MoaB [Deltaproteobacteria bacterium]|nr:molybdenum cofactor biosynthesis protein MoaB [Deltaproteobacteria bacterium]
MAHHHRASDARRVGCAVVTVSDTRRPADDRSGAVIKAALTDSGHAVVGATVVPDERDAIRAAVLAATDRSDVQAVIVTGGTGIARRDVTIESLAGAWTKELPGFGELFRALSFEEIGAAAFLSRAAAGVIGDTFVALLPGSPAACDLALRRLLLPELGHVAGLLSAGLRP